MDKAEFPARLVVSRYGERLDPPVKVWADEETLESDADLAAALQVYRGLTCGGVPYTLALASLADVDRVVAERRAELEALRGTASLAVANPGQPLGRIEPPTPSPLERAYLAARAAFAGQRKDLDRLREALSIVRGNQVERLGNGEYQVTSYGQTYVVNGACACDDYTRGVRWCKHRLAAALVRKAAELEKDGAGTAANSPARAVPSKGTKPHRQYNTAAAAAQA